MKRTLVVGLIIGALAIAFQANARDFGVDVSHFQASTGISQDSWNQMAADGKKFAFIKATEGLTVNDAAMANNVLRATNAGILAGVYHFAHPELHGGTSGAISEADHLINFAGDAIGPGHLRPVLDLEENASGLTDWVIAFINEVKLQKGAAEEPIIYTTSFFTNSALDSRVASYDLWLRDIDGSLNPATDSPPPSQVGVFNNWSFWQYSDTGSSGGISPLDLNVVHTEFKPLSAFMIPVPEPGVLSALTVWAALAMAQRRRRK